MKEYRGNEDGKDIPLNGGSYVDETGDAHEKYNFTPVNMEGREGLYCLGFFETKSHNGKDVNQMRIENIAGCELLKKEESVDDVLVVYCAKHPAHKFTTVVGWYKHATVYRHYQEAVFAPEDIQYYNAIANSSDCVLLPAGIRSRKVQWEVPRKSNGWAYGFGRANVWYASEEDSRLQDYLTRLVKQIDEYGIVCEEKWEAQHTPRVCYFLKEAYTSNENGYNLVEDLHDCERPWTMWRKVAIWTQAIYNAFNDNICEYDDEVLRSKEKEIIDRIAVVNVKKSNGGSESEYEDLKKYALEDRLEIKRELEIIQPDIIVCGNNLSLLKLVLGEELQNDDTWDNMLALWKDTLVLDYYHPAVHYPNRVNYYALMAICDVARKKYGTPVWSEQNEKY